MAHPQVHTPASPLAAVRSGRHRLRAVDPNEVVDLAQVADFLPPGATLLPAPPGTLPTLPGRPPMVGYLVLVPAEQQPRTPAVPAPAPVSAPEEPGPVAIDGVQRIAVVDGRALDLTYLEFELLAHLVAHPHRVHTRDQLVTTVWGYGHVGDGRTVDVHVARLRRKLGAEHRHTIQTVRRVGYKYTP
ncbi:MULTISPECIES: winged helix-turn-helix domain-containing protein [unclassified Streptomyces]|uniref:winged helix-turn-helix domain-containing protein n=1 Tax=unclassified Streptomyces TaxID=2593676 RepID=UPI001660CCB6|nr:MULTISPECIES: winged helix-turn-helix domain-containing protein [unclassified Streptomyces]MBD0711609.1 transcriptional regulator [Streptomyces sp. CBMA291]MBD0714806.1 transcriptional regulator [Streptomyces sp. CBMA370]